MAGLPDLEQDATQLAVDFLDLREECRSVLTKADQKTLFFFFLRIDCLNLVKLLRDPDAEIDLWGNYTAEQFADLITSAREMNFNVHRFPSFMSIFAREYNFNKDKKRFFPEDELAFQFLNYAIRNCKNSMVRNWYRLNLDISNILTALLARKQGWNVSDYIQGVGEVQEMIRENKTQDFDLSHKYDYVRDLMRIVEEDDPLTKEKLIDKMKWDWLDEQIFFDPFSIDALFAYLCKLEIQYRWIRLNPEKGKRTFEKIIDNLRGEVKVPEEFILQ